MSHPEALQRATNSANVNGHNYVVVKKSNGDYVPMFRGVCPLSLFEKIVEDFDAEVISVVTVR